MQRITLSEISPGRILLFSFLFVIGIGTFLLSLPICQKIPIPLIDILFTATSATCVTGLATIPVSSFTFLGHCVILCLMQIGGLGLMTLSFFFISLFLNLGMTAQLIAGELLEFKWWNKIKNFLAIIISITVIMELIGTILLYIPFRHHFPPTKAFFYALFHSVSAFCNAGITLFDTELTQFAQQPLMLFTLASLVFLGGIGFLVWMELINKIHGIYKRLQGIKTITYLSVHTKLVLTTSLFLIIGGTVVTFLLEQHNVLANVSLGHKLSISLFNSISIRNAGFHLLFPHQTTLATLLVFMFLMYIGASPVSTGSGVKTTTFAVFFATMRSLVRNRTHVEVFGRTIPPDQIYKAITIITISTTWIFMLTFLLLISEPRFMFIQVFFEAISAFSNCGLSSGITPYLSGTGKLSIILTMFIGRIGSLTLILALRKKTKKHLYQYPEERVVIG